MLMLESPLSDHSSASMAATVLALLTAGTAAGDYAGHAGMNCYTGHGGVNIDSGSAARTLALADCEAWCDATAACTCVVQGAAAAAEASKCWRRSACTPAGCASDSEYNTFIKPPVPTPPTPPTPTPPTPPPTVTPYPLASYQQRSAVFTLLAGGVAVPVQQLHDYHVAHFEYMAGSPLALRVTAGEVLTEWTVSPRSFEIGAEACGAGNGSAAAIALCFNITTGRAQPNYLILQLNALQKLVILAEEGAEVVPAHGIDVRAPPYNADPAGVVDATAALQAAIDDGAARRVPVVLQRGTFLVSTPALALRNHSDLFIAAGAVLRSTPDISRLPPPDPKSASCFVDPVIMLRDVADVTLRGRGTIDASGIALMQKEVGKGCAMKAPGYLFRRRIVSSIYSKVEAGGAGAGGGGGHTAAAARHGGRFGNVRIEGLTLRDATTWTAVVEKVSNYTVFQVKVLNHHNASVYKIENDGLDLVANANSSVDRCLIVTCDDAMCSKSSEKDAGVDNVAFTNSIVFSWCAGLKAGMQAESFHQNVLFRNNDVVQARRGLVVEVTEGEETMRAVTFRGVRVEALVRTAGKAPQAVEVNAQTAAISNVSYFEVSVAGVAAAREGGDKEGAVWVHGKSATKENVEGVHFHGLRLDGVAVLNAKAANLTAKNAKDITFDKRQR
jgi:polygalacturonase